MGLFQVKPTFVWRFWLSEGDWIKLLIKRVLQKMFKEVLVDMRLA